VIEGGTPTVEVRKVSKWFGQVVAVSEVSFEVGPGVTALLGPNGAGKSTLFRLICGLAHPSHGTVQLFGQNPQGNPELTRRIGIAPQQERLFERQTIAEFVATAAVLHGVPNPEDAARRAIETVELDPLDGRPLGAYSKGMRQRVKLAQALVHDPDLLVLDEPLDGLDPRQRLRSIDMFRRLGAEGKTVVVSSHVLEEVERFGSRILVIAQGRLLAEGPFSAIRDLMDDRPHHIRVGTAQPRSLAAGILRSGVASSARINDGWIEIETSDAPTFRRSIAGIARECDCRLTEVRALDDDLESVFSYLVRQR
jgi:ABC-2 type transport system ATP-binding protein